VRKWRRFLWCPYQPGSEDAGEGRTRDRTILTESEEEIVEEPNLSFYIILPQGLGNRKNDRCGGNNKRGRNIKGYRCSYRVCYSRHSRGVSGSLNDKYIFHKGLRDA